MEYKKTTYKKKETTPNAQYKPGECQGRRDKHQELVYIM